MDFAVAAARQVASAQVWALLAVPGDAVDPVDPRDVLAPGSWVLTASAGTAPIVRRVVPQGAESPPSAFHLDLDADLVAGASYSLALAPLTRSAHGEPTSTAAVAFVGLAAQARQGDVPGEPAADVALPVAAQGGEPRGLAPLEALKARLELRVSVRLGAFTHAPAFGRGVEPKRTYSQAALAQEAAAMARELRADPDVRAAEVASASQGHIGRFDITVEPMVGGQIRFSKRITAGGDP